MNKSDSPLFDDYLTDVAAAGDGARGDGCVFLREQKQADKRAKKGHTDLEQAELKNGLTLGDAVAGERDDTGSNKTGRYRTI